MSIEKEIERAVKRTIALDKDTPYKSAAEQEKIISDIKSALNDATFHFENSKSLMLNQSGKKRLVKQYDNGLLTVQQNLKISYVKASNKFWIEHLK